MAGAAADCSFGGLVGGVCACAVEQEQYSRRRSALQTRKEHFSGSFTGTSRLLHLILENDHFAGEGDGVVRLGRNEQKNCLERCCGSCFALATIPTDADLPEVVGTAVWGNRPKHVRQELRTKCRWLRHIFDFGLDARCTRARFDLCVVTPPVPSAPCL
jgi:hypothetical protein